MNDSGENPVGCVYLTVRERDLAVRAIELTHWPAELWPVAQAARRKLGGEWDEEGHEQG